MTVAELLASSNNELSDHDVAVLADWAGSKSRTMPSEGRKPYTLIREGCDLLLRRRALVKNNQNGGSCENKSDNPVVNVVLPRA